MTDLTPLFRQCVNIVQTELGDSINNDNASSPTMKINDSFSKETRDFYNLLRNLDNFIAELKVPYLSISETSDNTLSIQDKNKIDEEFNYKVQQMYEKLKVLQTYETKRQALSQQPKRQTVSRQLTSWLNMFDEPSDQELYISTVNTHRTQILRYLNNSLNIVNKNFDSIQRKRFERERQLNLLNFQNFDEDEDVKYDEKLNIYDPEDLFDVVQEEIADGSQLSQTQVQELEKENQEFLNMKTNQLKQVERLHTSMLDIVNLQTELSFQLDQQGDQINNLLDNNDQVAIDVLMGNKTLNKATVRNKKSANMLVTLCLVLGVLVLCVDYISF
jgi:t-SNARE complex subunit, syntaxin